MHDYRSIRFTLRLLVVAVVCAMAAAAPAAGQPAETSDAAQFDAAEADTLVEDFKQSITEIELLLRDISRDPHLSISTVVEAQDFDSENLLRWVSSETLWTPYPGRLRGSSGVLMDRRGNSLDRSLLLVEMLETAGFDTRLARVTLTESQAATLWSDYLAQVEAHQPDPQLNDQIQDRFSEFSAQVGRITAALTEKLANPLDAAREAESVNLDSIQDHWWVQVRQPSGWVDFDPVRGGEKPLELAAGDYFKASEVPAELDHELEVRLVIESISGGELQETTPLSFGMTAGQISVSDHLEIGFLPYSTRWDSDDDSDTAMSVTELADTAEFWLPVM